MNAFLRAARSLRGLVINAEYDPALEPNIESLAKPTLEVIMLRCSPPIGVYLGLSRTQPGGVHRHWTMQELRQIVYMCLFLTELAINFPPIPITFDLESSDLRQEAPEYLSFIVS
jgi:hypothetical protein